MGPFDFPTEIDDADVRARAVAHVAERGIRLPTFSELADPMSIPDDIRAQTAAIDPDEADPLNLFRVHWQNAMDRRGSVPVPAHIVLPKALTGVDAKIVVMMGAFFPMIEAHKVLAAYACLAPRLVTGRFDPTRQRAVWPSTGNYCRGGVAISRILGCRGVAVLPEGMSRERFDWLEKWVSRPEDVIRTPGTESNVKEIYDACAELEQDPDNEIVNQFSEFGNYLGHYWCTGPALRRVFDYLRESEPDLTAHAFVSASGSAGTLGTGDYLKEHLGARIAVVEALECPTLLYNGYGEHNIQGIGDKHVPLIHNVMNTDYAIAVSDRATDGLNAVFNTETGRSMLNQRMGVAVETLDTLRYFGFSSIANMLGAIKIAKQQNLGENDVVMTVATDGANLYTSELEDTLSGMPGGALEADGAAGILAEHLSGMKTDHMIEARHVDRLRMFNLGYFTWVEQQGVELADFDRRRDQSFWRGLHGLVPVWDELITQFNRDTRAAAA